MITTTTLAFGLFGFGPGELLIFGILGLLIFGSRLPSVGKNLGKGIIEFKRGLKGVQDDLESAGDETAPQPARAADLERERQLQERERQLLDRERALGQNLPSSNPVNQSVPISGDARRVSRADGYPDDTPSTT